MSILVKEFADYMETLGLGTVGTDIFISRQPKAVNDAITVYETSGQEADAYLPIKQPTIQIIVRSTSYETGRTDAGTVFDALHQKANVDLGEHYAYFILATSDVGYIGRDENERHEWSMNFTLKTRAG